MAHTPDSRKVTAISTPDDSEGMRVAGIVADASRALWVDDAAHALPRIAELLVAGGVAARAVLEVNDEGSALRGEARSDARSSAAHGGGSSITVPIVANQRTIGAISVELPPASHVAPAFLTAVLQRLAHFIGPAMATHRVLANERARLGDENDRLQRRLHGRHDLTSVIGVSDAMRQVREMVSRAALTGTPVLLEGEAGTGKEFLARTLHHTSAWARQPFVEYSCRRGAVATVEADLLELIRGRDVHETRPPLAGGGTLFLDDIHELTATSQAQLMRVLQQREFASSPSPAVRVIASSESSLERAATDGRFRADVFHRVSGFSIAVPRLRDRQADIPLLADYFLARFACDHGKTARRISARALDMLTRYAWPGHVRELANVIERAVLLCDEEVVHGHHLSPAIHGADGPPAPFSLSESLDAYEKDLLIDALRAARGVRSRAARLLQTTDRIFNYKVRKHAIDCRRFKS